MHRCGQEGVQPCLETFKAACQSWNSIYFRSFLSGPFRPKCTSILVVPGILQIEGAARRLDDERAWAEGFPACRRTRWILIGYQVVTWSARAVVGGMSSCAPCGRPRPKLAMVYDGPRGVPFKCYMPSRFPPDLRCLVRCPRPLADCHPLLAGDSLAGRQGCCSLWPCSPQGCGAARWWGLHLAWLL